MNLNQQINLTEKFKGDAPDPSRVDRASHVDVALTISKRLAESKKKEPDVVRQMAPIMPVPN